MELSGGTGSTIVTGRSCADCTLCCKLLSIAELAKPQQTWCAHCTVAVGCQIYESKPGECTDFFCGYLLNDSLGEEWRPSTCSMVVHYEELANRIVIHVDADRRDAWRTEPYFSQIKQWARDAAPRRGQVIVWQGLDAVAVLPDREKMLGRMGEDQVIISSERLTAHGVERDVHFMERDDPRLSGKAPQTEGGRWRHYGARPVAAAT